MIEIVPGSGSLTGSYNVPVAVDSVTYLYMYNEVFVEEWNQYIKKINAGPDFIKSKWLGEDSEIHDDGDIDTISVAEMIERGMKAKKSMDLRQGKKGRYFEKLADDFDRERDLITLYKNNFYAYEISKLADHASVFQIEKNEITNILNYLYLRIKKKKRIITREGLFGEL